MKRVLLAAAAVLCGACAPQKVSEGPLRWTLAEMLARKNPTASFGGFHPGGLVLRDGETLPFEKATSAGEGLVVHPGMSEGQSAPFVVTDIWQDHPEPWVEPVWVPLDADGKPLAADSEGKPARNVFSLDVDSTFYSPFWLLENVSLAGVSRADDQPRSGTAMINAAATRAPGPRVYCPITPADLHVAHVAGAAPLDPISLTPVQQLDPRAAWADGRTIYYLPFGPNRFQGEYQRAEPVDGYFFVSQAGGELLPVAAVFAAGVKEHSFVQRVDVVLPVGAGVYVPDNRPELRDRLSGLVAVPSVSAANGAHPERALQVALNAECFSGDFSKCQWLDSEAAIRAAALVTVEQEIQFALGVLTP